MRIAKCVAPIQVHVTGNRAGVMVTQGWQGDLDQVIGVTEGGSMTLAEGLGPFLTPANFDEAPPAKPAAKRSAAQPQE